MRHGSKVLLGHLKQHEIPELHLIIQSSPTDNRFHESLMNTVSGDSKGVRAFPVPSRSCGLSHWLLHLSNSIIIFRVLLCSA